MNKGNVLWFTGKPCSGKSTIAEALAKKLVKKGIKTQILDGDIIRKDLCKDLGFSEEDRKKNLERIRFVAKILADNGITVLCAFVSPSESVRNSIKEYVGDNFKEIYVECSSEVCAKRDVKGMWKMAKEGKIKNFTGYDAPYEAPTNSDLVLNTEDSEISDCVDKCYELVKPEGREIYYRVLEQDEEGKSLIYLIKTSNWSCLNNICEQKELNPILGEATIINGVIE